MSLKCRLNHIHERNETLSYVVASRGFNGPLSPY